MSSRVLSPYEINQLHKYGFNPGNIDNIGDTPVEYLTGHAEFCGLDFTVNSNTLIPRIESEQIVSLATSFLYLSSKNHIDIADIGTGSGCLGISLAINLLQQSFNNFNVWLSDISPLALHVAERNQSKLLPDQEDRFHFLLSNLLDDYPPEQKFDLIVANLPYIPSKRVPTLDNSVKNYEPHLALDGGEDGTNIINNLLQKLSKHLKANSHLILEIDSTHTLENFSIPPFFTAKIINDVFDKPRFLILQHST